MKVIFLITTILAILLQAKVVSIESEATYNCNKKYENCSDKNILKKMAIELAKIDTIEEIGTVVKSTIEVSDDSNGKHFSKHYTKSYAVGLLKTKVLETKFTNNAKSCYVKILSSIDTDELNSLSKRVVENDVVAQEIRKQQELQLQKIKAIAQRLQYLEENKNKLSTMSFSDVAKFKSIEYSIEDSKNNYFLENKNLKNNIHELINMKKGAIYESFLQNKIALENAKVDLELNFIDEYMSRLKISASEPQVINKNDKEVEFVFDLNWTIAEYKKDELYFPCGSKECKKEANYDANMRECLKGLEISDDGIWRTKIMPYKIYERAQPEIMEKYPFAHYIRKTLDEENEWIYVPILIMQPKYSVTHIKSSNKVTIKREIYQRNKKMTWFNTLNKYDSDRDWWSKKRVRVSVLTYDQYKGIKNNDKTCDGEKWVSNFWKKKPKKQKYRWSYGAYNFIEGGVFKNINGRLLEWLSNDVNILISFETNLGPIEQEKIKVIKSEGETYSEIPILKKYKNAIGVLRDGKVKVRISFNVEDTKDITGVFAVPRKIIIN